MLRLHLRAPDTIPIRAECIVPDRLATLSNSQIAGLTVHHGNRAATLGDFFELSGDSSDADIEIDGDCAHVTYIGVGITGGRLTIRGNAGPHLGSRMTGGMIDVFGDAGDWAGAEMRGGRIHIHGSAGNHAGAAYSGNRRGMRGGVILIDGNAGDEVGAAMRRGIIAVGGTCGEFAAAAVIAGTVLVFGEVGRHLAAGLKRGTVMTFGPPPALLPTFRYDCSYRPPIVDLYLRQLRSWGFTVPDAVLRGSLKRYRGDFASLAKGDVLTWIPA
jgi:formylmethanofuran dehydrogenase subunit C